MDVAKLTISQRQIRSNVRNFLYVATMSELKAELKISDDLGDKFRSECILELMREVQNSDN